MNHDLKRVVGFILYHKDKVRSNRCEVCEHKVEQEKSQICYACHSADGTPHWKENKALLQADWDSREYNWPWEDRLPPEVASLLDKIEVFTADEVVDIVSTIMTSIHAWVEADWYDVINAILLEKYSIKHKRLDHLFKIVEVK